MYRYEHIFFDLDRTLWDFDANSRAALSIIFVECELIKRGVESFDDFMHHYQLINKELWELYRDQRINQQELRWRRFDLSLKHYKIDDPDLAHRMGKRYLEISPLQTGLLPGAMEVLDHLSQRYRLHIITNGFEGVQQLKLQNSGLSSYFDVVVTSDGVGCKKPALQIFEMACRNCGAMTDKSLMIGDDLETDIAGAQNAGMDHVYFNRSGMAHTYSVTHEIRHLADLKDIL